jgi:hypothetical protein
MRIWALELPWNLGEIVLCAHNTLSGVSSKMMWILIVKGEIGAEFKRREHTLDPRP